MAEYSDILAALDTKLNTFAGANSYPVAWVGVAYTPDENPYLAPSFIPAQTGFGGLSAGSYQDYAGIYQIDVRTPKGRGMSDSRAITQAVLDEFSKASTTVFNGVNVLIEQSWASSLFDIDGAWFSVPVSVRYRVLK